MSDHDPCRHSAAEPGTCPEHVAGQADHCVGLLASGWYSSYRTGETAAAAEVLVDRAADLVVGAHLLGPEYSEVVNTFGLAMRLGLTTRQLRSAPAAYPSVGSDLASML